jgi:hypothetical protein
MTTQDSIKFHHDLNSIIREGAKAKGIEKSAARRLTEDAVGAFEESYLELRRDQRRCTRAIRVIDYPEGGKKKVKKLDKKATKERAAQLEVRAAVQAKFVGIHRAFKKFCQGRIDAAKGVAAAKKYLGVKLSTKAFEALAALWAKHAGFESKEEHAAKAPSRKAAKAKKPAKKARKTRKVKDDESSDDESSDDESSDESDDDEKPAKRKLAKKPAKKEKKVARVKPTKKRVVEDSDESDDSSDDDSSDDDSSDDSSDDESDDSSD